MMFLTDVTFWEYVAITLSSAWCVFFLIKWKITGKGGHFIYISIMTILLGIMLTNGIHILARVMRLDGDVSYTEAWYWSSRLFVLLIGCLMFALDVFLREFKGKTIDEWLNKKLGKRK